MRKNKHVLLFPSDAFRCKMHKNALALPRTPLGEITGFPDSLARGAASPQEREESERERDVSK